MRRATPPLPPQGGNPAEWQNTYARYAGFLAELARLAKRFLGLDLNHSKGSLLLPPGAPLPNDEVRSLFPEGFVFRTDGVIIAGAPVGTDAFTRSFMAKKLQVAKSKLEAIKAMGAKSARAAHRLLVSSATKYFQYITSR